MRAGPLQGIVVLNTFTLIAKCPDTGMLGAASCTGRPFVGAMLPQGRPEVGMVSSQALPNPYLGLALLDRLAEGVEPESAMTRLLGDDPGRDQRQVALIDGSGRAAAFTGQENIGWAGHLVGDGYVAAGNMLTGPRVLEVMATEFEGSADLEIGERLLRALESVERQEGGDVRGKISAVLYVAGREVYGYLDLRVDEHTQPITELRRLYQVWERVQRPYQTIMPTREDPFGVVDAAAIATVRANLSRY